MIHHPFPESAQITDEELTYSRSDMWQGLDDEPAVAQVKRFTAADILTVLLVGGILGAAVFGWMA